MNAVQVPSLMRKWYGANDARTRTEVKRLLTGVRDMLDNVDYVFPGPECSPHTYAYVYPGSSWSKNSQGQYIVYLCEYYMTCPLGEKIETLTHEGSHHQPMSCDDTEFNGDTAYGRYTCEQMGSSCRNGNAAHCTAALRNADSLCYFINDASGHEDEGRSDWAR